MQIATARFPHARGDGPGYIMSCDGNCAFSPRPWGWSAAGNPASWCLRVFPTPVGMVLSMGSGAGITLSFPHARGDGPAIEFGAESIKMFSPRPWGWSAPSVLPPTSGGVFPTPVGMVRCRNSLKCTPPSFPHARGDGPCNGNTAPLYLAFSPRPWGWSVPAIRRSVCVHVFPTPVGMVRTI